MRFLRSLLSLCLCVGVISSPILGFARTIDEVVVTIKPLHSLVSAVMGRVHQPVLLLERNESPHDFQLRPLQIRKLQEAQIIFFMDEQLESFLLPAFASLPPTSHKVALSRTPGLLLLTQRHHENWQSHSHGKPHEIISSYDAHLWLNPANAKKMLSIIVAELSLLYPENQKKYLENAQRMSQKIDIMDQKLQTQLVPLHHKRFIVFHDAYQYFEQYYGLQSIGSITIEPNQPVSARHLQSLRALIGRTKTQCIFREPQFSDRLINTVSENNAVKTGILDPIGADLRPGPDLYIQLMENLSHNLRNCLLY